MPFFKAGDIDVHYRVIGEGPWLVILGGLGDNARNWSAIAARLGRRFKVLLVDNRGAGESSRPPGPYRIQDMAGDVIRLLDGLGVERAHVMGFSMGGKIALRLALTRPDLVDRLILVASTAAYEKNASPAAGDVQNLLENFSNDESHFKAQFEILFSDSHKKKFSADSFAKFKLEEPHPQSREDFLAQYEAVRGFDVSGDVHLVLSPTLVISGTEDRMTPHENSEWLAENIPHARLILYPGVGHIPQAERTKRFLEDVTGFLTGS